MPTVKVNGLNLHYEERTTSTSKDPLLMIMGFTFSLLDWGDDLPKELSKFYRVITFDNRASGLSDTPHGIFYYFGHGEGCRRPAFSIKDKPCPCLRDQHGGDDCPGTSLGPSDAGAETCSGLYGL